MQQRVHVEENVLLRDPRIPVVLPVRGQCRIRDVIDAAIPVQDHRDLVADRPREIQGRGCGRPIRLAFRGGRQVGEQVRLTPGGGGEGLPRVEGECLVSTVRRERRYQCVHDRDEVCCRGSRGYRNRNVDVRLRWEQLRKLVDHVVHFARKVDTLGAERTVNTQTECVLVEQMVLAGCKIAEQLTVPVNLRGICVDRFRRSSSLDRCIVVVDHAAHV